MALRSRGWRRTFLGLCLIVGWAAVATAQDTSYIQIPTIPGDSVDPNHTGWITAYGLSSASSSPPAGGDPDHDEIHVLKGTDNATPPLLLALSQATNLGTVAIEVCRNPGGGGQECYYKLELQNTRVINLSLSGSSCIDPGTSCTPSQTESVTFAFSKITWKYYGFGKSKNTCGCWDLALGKSCTCVP
jgi:type VI secretion system Hcp family effector